MTEVLCEVLTNVLLCAVFFLGNVEEITARSEGCAKVRQGGNLCWTATLDPEYFV